MNVPAAESPSMREILDRLVSFDTVSHRSNRALVEFVGAYLARHGIDAHVMESGDGRKANLFATIGENRTGGVALSGHTDVVPVEGQTWGTDPFRVQAADGRLYGRGTCDMKGFIAAVLAAVPKFCERRLSVPIHILLSYDEEIGCVGVRPMIEAIGRNLPMPEIVIVGEPTNMRVVHAHKGFSGFRTTITGQAAHSSLPHLGASAILIANRLIAGLAEIVAGVQARTAPDSPFFPPDTTFNIGRIAGGNAVNIIPESCVIEWECRPVARGDMTEITERFEKLCREVRASEAARIEGVTIRTEVTADVPPCEPRENSAAEALVKHLLGTNRSEAVSFGTEAALFQEKGMSVVICGPGNMDQAHQPNEFVAEEQLEQCEAFLGKLLDWAAPGD